MRARIAVTLREDRGMRPRPTLSLLLVSAFLVAMTACGPKGLPSGKRYTAQGEVKALDAGAKTATIAFGKIGDWMDPMTMEYKIQPDGELQKMHVGDRIDATVVVVSDTQFYVTDVKVLPKS
jgi:Cu/Ag efflux protein CusF